MTRLTKLLLLVAALAVPSMPARASMAEGNAGVILNFLETADGTWLFVRVEARYRIPMEGDVTVTCNGQVVKIEPVAVRDMTLVTAYLGPNGKDYSACAKFNGLSLLGGDNFVAAHAAACSLRSPFTPITVARPGRRAPQPAAKTAPLPLPLRD